jgi:integrase
MPAKTNTTINGKDYFRVRVQDGRNPDGSIRYKEFYGKSKKEAEEKADEYKIALAKGYNPAFAKLTFGAAFERWSAAVDMPSLSANTQDLHDSWYRNYVKDCELYQLKLADIHTIDIQSYYENMIKNNATAYTVKSIHKYVNKFFNYAVKTDMIAKNPMAAAELPKDNAIEEEVVPFTFEEIGRFVGASEKKENDFIFTFAVFTGLRQGELLALTNKDIDMSSGLIHVRKSLGYSKGGEKKYHFIVGPPKNPNSYRDVPIVPEIKPLLEAYISSEEKKALKRGKPLNGDSVFFSSAKGGYIINSTLRRRFKELTKKLEIDYRKFHALRHTFCTILCAVGVPMEVASDLMGHGDIRITKNIYTHVNIEMKQEQIAKLGKIINHF